MTRAIRRETAQSEILSAAASIIAHYGYHGTSMRDLAKATGRGLSSLYTYFPSKEVVLFALQTRAFDTLVASAEAAAPASAPAERRLYAFILNHIRYFLAHPDVMRVLVQEARVLPPRHRRRVRAQKERYYALAEDIIGSLRGSSGSQRALSQDDLERTTYGFFGLVNWVWAWYEPERHGQPRDVARTLHTLIVRGVTGRSPAASSWDGVEDVFDLGRVDSPLAVPARSRKGASKK